MQLKPFLLYYYNCNTTTSFTLSSSSLFLCTVIISPFQSFSNNSPDYNYQLTQFCQPPLSLTKSAVTQSLTEALFFSTCIIIYLRLLAEWNCAHWIKPQACFLTHAKQKYKILFEALYLLKLLVLVTTEISIYRDKCYHCYLCLGDKF